jgi:oligopeptide transport system substrate-binding protein
MRINQPLKTTVTLLTLACLLAILAMAGCSPLRQVIETIDSDTAAQGTLNLWDTGPLTLDPAISSEMSSHIYVMQIYSGLVKFDARLMPLPDLAERWEASQDGKTYTFHLRKEAKFHDGRKVTAGDIRYSWERACDPATGSQTASIYLSDIVGALDKLSGKSASISGISVIDDYTLRVSIDAPRAYFLSKLAYPTAFIVDKKNVEGGRNWWKKPNGTGPYRLGKWEEGSFIGLSPNPNFYGKRASLKVSFQILSGIPMSLYEKDKIDVVEITKAYIDRASDESGPFYNQLHIYPEFSLNYIGFNCSKPPFDDPLVRQAFCHAVNKDRIIKTIQKDMVSRVDGIIPPGMPGHNKDIGGLAYDPEKAKQLLAKSKYGANLPPVTITMPGWGGVDIDDFVGAVLQDWKNTLGVNVSVRLLEPNAFHYSLSQEADELYTLGWIADYPDPQNFLYTLFYTGTEYNNSHFSSAPFDKLLDQAAVEQDYEKRMKMYQEAERMVVEAAPILPLWANRNYMLVKPDVLNYEIDPLGVPRLNLVTLDK